MNEHGHSSPYENDSLMTTAEINSTVYFSDAGTPPKILNKVNNTFGAFESPHSNRDIIQQRSIKKPKRNLVKYYSAEKEFRRSSWSEGSFGFGSLDLITNLDVKTQLQNKTTKTK